MTPSDIINKVKSIKPSVLEDSALLSFINKIEAKLRLIVNDEDAFNPIEYEDISKAGLLLDEKHSDIYLYYVASQIDLFTNDIASYNNFTMLFNDAMKDYMNYYKARKQPSPARQYDYKGAFRR